MIWPVKKALISVDVWELALSWWTKIRLLLFVFRIYPKTKTLGKQIVVCHLDFTVLRCSLSPHDQFCRKSRRPFASKWFFHKQLSLDLARVQRPTRWTVALFWSHTHRSMIRHLWLSFKHILRHRHCSFATFLYTNRHERFFERLSSCAGSNDNISFWKPVVLQYWMYAGGRNTQGCLNPTVCHMTILHY